MRICGKMIKNQRGVNTHVIFFNIEKSAFNRLLRLLCAYSFLFGLDAWQTRYRGEYVGDYRFAVLSALLHDFVCE